MRILRQALLPLGLLLLLAAIWVGLLRTERSATWLQAEAPRTHSLGQILPVRVILAAPEDDTRLGVDLHWTTSRREPRGFLSTSPARPLAAQRYRTVAPPSARGVGSAGGRLRGGSGLGVLERRAGARRPCPDCSARAPALLRAILAAGGRHAGNRRGRDRADRFGVAAITSSQDRPRAGRTLALRRDFVGGSRVSFHEIDRLLASPIFSIPLAQVAKLWIAVAIPVCGQRPFPTRPSAAPGPEAARSAPVSPRAE